MIIFELILITYESIIVFFEAPGIVVKIGWIEPKPNHHEQIKFVQIHETLCSCLQ